MQYFSHLLLFLLPLLLSPSPLPCNGGRHLRSAPSTDPSFKYSVDMNSNDTHHAEPTPSPVQGDRFLDDNGDTSDHAKDSRAPRTAVLQHVRHREYDHEDLGFDLDYDPPRSHSPHHD